MNMPSSCMQSAPDQACGCSSCPSIAPFLVHWMAAQLLTGAGLKTQAPPCVLAPQVCFSLQLESVVVLEYQGPAPQQHKQPAAAPAGQAIEFHR